LTPGSGNGVDALIAALAAEQHRLVTRRQLLGAGVGNGAIKQRLANARLHQLHRGVYAVGTPRVDRLGRWLAAVLACGEGAVLSHLSAAALFGLLAPMPGPVDVLVPGGGSARRPGIRIHGTRSLPAAEVVRRRRVPCTSVERTLVDLADRPLIDRAVEQAFALRLLGRTRMADALRRANGKPGTKELRRLLTRLLEDFPLTRSELERRFLRLLAEAGLPAPLVNRHRAGHRVDFHWPEYGLVVETDGRATHDNPYAFHQDRARDLDLELADVHVIRLSWWQIVNEPERVLQLLHKRLS
jgi:very-short-patch-repair endonuclease